MQAVKDFDQHDAHVRRGVSKQFVQAGFLHLLAGKLFAAGGFPLQHAHGDVFELGDAIHQQANFAPEFRFDLGNADAGIFGYVVQQGRH